MAMWLVRAGRTGEFEDKFFSTNAVYFTWDDELGEHSFEGVEDWEAMRAFVAKHYHDQNTRVIGNHAGQAAIFRVYMKPGDIVLTPRKSRGTIAVGQVVGTYEFVPGESLRFRHRRAMKWINTSVPRTDFDPDLLNSMGAQTTFCEIKRNNAEKRVRAMIERGFVPVARGVSLATTADVPRDETGHAPDAEDLPKDYERLARDQIVRHVGRKFTSHRLTDLIDAILRSQGYKTHVSPPGPDKGVDILAAPAPLGFGSPKLCVQVKSGDIVVDRPTLDQLIGVMQKFQAQQGLLVSWGGFKSSVEKELANEFFRVRLWDREDVVDEICAHFDKFPEDLKAELPLKRIWSLAVPDEDES